MKSSLAYWCNIQDGRDFRHARADLSRALGAAMSVYDTMTISEALDLDDYQSRVVHEWLSECGGFHSLLWEWTYDRHTGRQKVLFIVTDRATGREVSSHTSAGDFIAHLRAETLSARIPPAQVPSRKVRM